MDKAYKFFKSHTSLISTILLGCAAFSAVITLERADYNLFLFLYVTYSMFWKSDEPKPKQNIIILERMLFTLVLTASLLVDLIWIFTHSDINSSFIIYLSWIEFYVKILVVAVVFVMWQGYKKECFIPTNGDNNFDQLEEES